MKIACIYPGSFNAAWSVCDGITSTLRRMGYEVTDCPRGRPRTPRITKELLSGQNLIVMSGHEHILENSQLTPFNKNELSLQDWKGLAVPRVFWAHESFTREDRSWNFTPLAPLADYHFFPAWQDADHYDQEQFGAKGRVHWLPFGVDTDVFRPARCQKCFGSGKLVVHGMKGGTCDECLGAGFQATVKTVDLGFIGLLYPKRVAFFNQLVPHIVKNPQPGITIGEVSLIQDIEGPQWRETVERLASNYRRIGIFLNLPHLSQLLVTKVFEVMACGTFIMTPELDGRAEKNMVFGHMKELVYYGPRNIPYLWQVARYMHEHPEERERIALAGMYEIRAKHTLQQRLEEMLAAIVGLNKRQEEQNECRDGATAKAGV